jgi:membrane-associated phospholipid phosphatase
MKDALITKKEGAEPWTLARGIRQTVLLAVIMVASLSLYLVVLKWRGPAGSDHVTYVQEWDELIPFQPEWVWVYLIPYLLGPLCVALLSKDTFNWYVRRGLPLVAVTLLIFIIYPTQTRPRVHTELGDGLTAQLYRNMVAIDEPPANAAPSLHVSLTCLLAWAFLRDFPRWWPLTCGAVLLVWLATLFTRQHHIIDVATGALLGTVFALPFCLPGRSSLPAQCLL